MENPLVRHIRSNSLLTEQQLADALEAEKETGWSLDRVILTKGLLSEHDLLKAVAASLALPYRESLADSPVPSEFVEKVPVQFARNYYLVGPRQADGVMQVATASPLDAYPMDDLATMLGCELEPVLAPRTEITSLINKAYKNKQDIVEESIGELEDGDIMSLAEGVEVGEDILDVANKAPIIKLVNMLFFQALKMRASDIHLQPYEDRLQVRYRIDGMLYDMEAVPKKRPGSRHEPHQGHGPARHRRAPPPAGRPRDGPHRRRRGRRAHLERADEPRASASCCASSTSRPASTSSRRSGSSTRTSRLVEQFIDYDHGIIFVSGPTGSGKTTTLYASLSRINSTQMNVMTIEDPIEYHLQGISQIQVNEKKGLTFASGLRSLLRQDPDIMMVGEVRDVETARIAIQAAQTGHLVFSHDPHERRRRRSSRACSTSASSPTSSRPR